VFRLFFYSPAIWGVSGSDIGRIGVIAHETGTALMTDTARYRSLLGLTHFSAFRVRTGHFLGIPDLYDDDGGGRGLGNYCLMANSWGWDKSQQPPGSMSCWTKMELGWLLPKTPAYGVNTISDSSSTSDCFLIGDGKFGFPYGEYLLIENRQPKGLDATLLQGGLAIYHVDEYARFNNEGYPGQNNWPRNGRHYRVALLAADGNYDLEKRFNYGDAMDFFHSDGVNQLLPSDNEFGPYPNTDSYQFGKIEQTNVQIFDISKSNDTMTFTFTDGNVVLPTLSPTTSYSPTETPSIQPSEIPSIQPTASPSSRPTSSSRPSLRPSESPSTTPTVSKEPTEQPSSTPTLAPSRSAEPSRSDEPSMIPSDLPSLVPSHKPSLNPSTAPSSVPSLHPSEFQCSEQGQICQTLADCCNEKAKCKEDKAKEDFLVDVQYVCSK
jgi:hypothetical protein